MRDEKLRKAFEASLEFMWDGESERDRRNWYIKKHICDALERAEVEGLITQKMADKARDIIHSRMAPSTNVIEWLAAENLIPTLESAYYEHERDVQIFRTRWVKELIKEFS